MHRFPTLTIAFLLLILSGCASTSIVSSWSAPEVTGPLAFEKTLVLIINPSETIRRVAETRLVQRIGPDRAVAAYTLLPLNDAQDMATARARIEGEGFDGAVVMRVIGTDEQLTYTPGMSYPSYYGSFWGYYGYGWPAVYQPGYLSQDTIVSVETNLYSVTDERLIWSGISETFNPTDTEDMVDDIADAVSDELRAAGLIGE